MLHNLCFYLCIYFKRNALHNAIYSVGFLPVASLTEIITYLPICLVILMVYLTQRLLVIVEMTVRVAGELPLLFVSLILEPKWNGMFQK